MRPAKPNFVVYSSLSRLSAFNKNSRPADILDLIKKNKLEEKRVKLRNVFTAFGFVGATLTIGILIYL